VSDTAVLSLAGVGKRFRGGIVGLDRVDLDIVQGEFLSLLGPSGCGKTTMLRVIAGFEQPSEGRVLLDGRDVTALRPYDRPVNTVFQDYALFPHMDVGENVGFGLSLRRVAAGEASRKVRAALELVGLAEKEKARVSALSGGQRQRVALARALVCEPRVLLLDEPLSALDAHLREQMQIELKRLQARTGTTFVMVTHDQTEALGISDRIAVMSKGRIEQVASPATLYDQPATRFVASFIGTMNVVPCRVVDRRADGVTVEAGALRFTLPALAEIGAVLTAGIRPEDLVVSADGDEGAAARVVGSVFHGRSVRLHAEIEGGPVVIADVERRPGAPPFEAGAPLRLSLRNGAARALAEAWIGHP